MNKKSVQDKQNNLYKLIEDYAASFKKYEKALLEGQIFGIDQVNQQKEFLKMLFGKLERYSKSKLNSKYFSQLKHIEFVLSELSTKQKNQSKQLICDEVSIKLKKQAMIIEHQDEQIRRLSHYSSTNSLLSQQSQSPSVKSLHNQLLQQSEYVPSSRLKSQMQNMQSMLQHIRSQNQQLKQTNKVLLEKLNSTNQKLNALLNQFKSIEKHIDEDLIDSPKKITIDTQRSLEFIKTTRNQKIQEHFEKQSLFALRLDNQKLTRKIDELIQQLHKSRKQNDLLRQKYLRSKHNISRADSSEDLLKRKGSIKNLVDHTSEQLKIQKSKKLIALNDLKSLVANHRKGISTRVQDITN